jgi:anti-sigma regulatory factor (Ser/Thr protein kinase)
VAPFREPLPEPPVAPHELAFRAGPLDALRNLVSEQGREAGLGPTRTGELVLAVHELATNSLRHGGGEGVLRLWQEGETVVCEVRDAGRLDQPLAGRERPALGRTGGRGLWLVNQLCDLVQIRSLPTGTVIRLHTRPAWSR